jgi:predicted nucleic acid-binding protein
MLRLVAGRRISAEAGWDVVTAAAEAVVLHPHPPLTRTAWWLRHDVSFYDATYVAVAERLGLALLTKDARLAGAPDLPCTVDVV